MYNTTLFLRIWAVIAGILGPPTALLTGGFSAELVVAIVVSFCLAWPVFILTHISGNSLVNTLFGLQRPHIKRDRLVGEYQKAKFNMTRKKYRAAIEILDQVLVQEPAYGDALLLKAQVFQRMGDNEKARQVVQVLLKNCSGDTVNCRWTFTLLQELDDTTSDSKESA